MRFSQKAVVCACVYQGYQKFFGAIILSSCRELSRAWEGETTHFVVEAMKELREVRAIPVKVRSTTIWVRTDITGNVYKLFSAIGLKAPPKILHLDKVKNVVAQTETIPVTN